MNRTTALIFVCVGLPLVQIALCHAETIPKPGRTDPRVREVIYDANDVIRLTGHVGYDTHLKFSEGEEFLGIGTGDAQGLDVAADGNDVWIKPKAPLVRTNIDVKTNKRVYHFDYQARKNLPKNRYDMIYSINFSYPEDEARKRTSRYAQAQLRQKLAATAHGANRNYWYCGSPSMKPVEAYDDGVQTHIRFNAYAEFPAIFVENGDATEALINFNIVADEVIVHRIAHRFIVRRGDLVGCIENRQFTGGGKRLSTQTIHQDIAREIKHDPESTDE
jgi:type IV secretion system protein VirB9